MNVIQRTNIKLNTVKVFLIRLHLRIKFVNAGTTDYNNKISTTVKPKKCSYLINQHFVSPNSTRHFLCVRIKANAIKSASLQQSFCSLHQKSQLSLPPPLSLSLSLSTLIRTKHQDEIDDFFQHQSDSCAFKKNKKT